MLETKDIKELSSNRLVPYYLMAGWLYNNRDKIIMSDDAWDLICKRLIAEWKNIIHPHKKCIEYESLTTATSMYLKDNNVPEIAKSAAMRLYEQQNTKPVQGLESFFD